jgi:spore germination protein GerM
MRRLVLAAAAAAIVVGCSRGEDEAGRVWFVDGHMSALGMRGKIETVERESVTTPQKALAELLKGPAQQDRSSGLITAIPRSTRVETLAVSRATATVRLRSSASPREWRSGFYATAQVVYTLTELDDIDRVKLFVNGERCCVYDMSTRPINRPLTRAIFRGWQGDPLPPPG